MRLCTYKTCTEKHYTKGYCRQHFNQLLKPTISKEWNSENKEKKAASTARWYQEHRKYRIEYCASWYKNNPGKKAAYTAKRKAAKLRATPSWANLSEIEKIYENCPEGYEVDHIIPLQGKNVCGLHVEYNLQYLTETENQRKGNKTV